MHVHGVDRAVGAPLKQRRQDPTRKYGLVVRIKEAHPPGVPAAGPELQRCIGPKTRVGVNEVGPAIRRAGDRGFGVRRSAIVDGEATTDPGACTSAEPARVAGATRAAGPYSRPSFSAGRCCLARTT